MRKPSKPFAMTDVKIRVAVKVCMPGPFVLEGGKLERVLTSSGYIKADTAYYFLRDHQGSVRQVVSGADGSIVQENQYYPYGSLHGESSAQALANGAAAQPYKYGGKEHISLANAHLLDFTARTYDPATLSFYQPDPLQEKFLSLSSYIYCKGNPINFIDSDGKRPSANEAALMAAYVYEIKKKDTTKKDLYMEQLKETGWALSSKCESVCMNYTKWYQNGLQSVLLERTVDGKTEYAYVFAGTNSVRDGYEDIAQLEGLSFQYYVAISNGKEISSELEESELTFVGHSLGGGEAIASSKATGRPAITFNSAAVGWFTKLFGGLFKKSDIVNYRAVGEKIGIGQIRIGGDWLNNLQQKVPGLGLPGKTVGIPTGRKITHTIDDFLTINLPEP